MPDRGSRRQGCSIVQVAQRPRLADRMMTLVGPGLMADRRRTQVRWAGQKMLLADSRMRVLRAALLRPMVDCQMQKPGQKWT